MNNNEQLVVSYPRWFDRKCQKMTKKNQIIYTRTIVKGSGFEYNNFESIKKVDKCIGDIIKFESNGENIFEFFNNNLVKNLDLGIQNLMNDIRFFSSCPDEHKQRDITEMNEKIDNKFRQLDTLSLCLNVKKIINWF